MSEASNEWTDMGSSGPAPFRHPEPLDKFCGDGAGLTSSQQLSLDELFVDPDTGEVVRFRELYPAYSPSSTIFSSGLRYIRTAQGTPKDLWGMKCGDVRFVVACPDRHEKHLVHHVCHRLQCPTCYENAASRSAHRIEERLKGLHAAYKRNGIRLGKPKHIVFSPPQVDWPRERLEADGGRALRRQLCRLLWRYAKDRVYGGDIIVHGERRKHLDGSDCDARRCRQRHQWVWGPHIHFIGYGFFENSALFHAESGWVYKRVEDDGERDIFSTAKYQLTHAALFLGADGEQVGTAYHHIGQMANCKGGRTVLDKQQETVPCDTCKKELHEYAADGNEPDLANDRGEHLVWRVEVEWYINGRAKKFVQKLLAEWLEGDGGG